LELDVGLFATPEGTPPFDDVNEHGDAVIARNAKSGQLAMRSWDISPWGNSQHETSVCETIEGGEAVGRAERVTKKWQENRCAETDPGRPGRHGGDHGERIGARSSQQGLADPYRVEPRRLRHLGRSYQEMDITAGPQHHFPGRKQQTDASGWPGHRAGAEPAGTAFLRVPG
jgi:hypothetical protein